MYRFLVFIIVLTGFWNSVLAIEFPFTDITTDNQYYTAVKNLYEKGILSGKETPTFNPDSPLRQDFYASILVGVGCKKCNTPTQEDIIDFSIPPFGNNVTKDNQYYYCISYAKSKLEMDSYSSNAPITRISATVALLKRANLWNEKLNTASFKKDLKITDIPSTDELYGYAKKGIEIGLIKQDSNKNIGKDTELTRGEFVLMAEKILKYTQCKTSESSTSQGGIEVKENGGKFELIPITDVTGGSYSWEIINQNDSTEKYTFKTTNLEQSDIPIGSWIIELTIKDKKTNKILSQPTMHLNVINSTTYSSTAIKVDKLNSFLGDELTFTPSGGSNPDDNYSWDFGDKTSNSTQGVSKHAYTDPGIYTVTLTIHNTSSNTTRQATIVIKISGDKDSDGDKVFDASDTCPYVVGSQSYQGCPNISVFDYRNSVGKLLGGGTVSNGSPQILDGIKRNSCLENKLKNGGMIFGSTPTCSVCPCPSTIEIQSIFRSCDIIFPAILSTDSKKIYSRGGFYTIP